MGGSATSELDISCRSAQDASQRSSPGPPAAALLWLTGFGDVSVGPFVLYKAVLGVALGAVFTPVVALGAISEILPGVNRRGEI